MLSSFLVQATERSGDQLLDALEAGEHIDHAKRERLESACSATRRPLEEIILDLGFLDDQRLAAVMAEHFGIPFASSEDFPDVLPPDIEWDEAYLRHAGLVPLETSDTAITLATAILTDTDAPRALGFHLSRAVILKVAASSEIARQMGRLLSKAAKGANTAANGPDVLALTDVERLKDAARDAPVVRAVTELLSETIGRRGSDIHIEPRQDHVAARVRIDGVLQDARRFPLSYLPGIVTRIKIMAGLNIAEQRLPQDGRIRTPVRGRDTDLRVSTMPVIHGESIAIRILSNHDRAPDLESLGFSDDARLAFERMVRHPNGIVLVTGPTGSGKTTTLHAAMRRICTGGLKAFTVEDPVEFELEGVNQIQVKTQIGLDFATVLRSILRQDPDIIMVGEIRDRETAEIAFRAAMTGHLVLSSLHTNSAAAAVTRLVDIGVEPYLIGSTLRGVVAQRLVRKLCENCKTARPATASEIRLWPELREAEVSDAGKCGHCDETGFVGRTAICEHFEMNLALAERLTQTVNESSFEAALRDGGMVSLTTSGLDKVRAGVTTLQDAVRAVMA